MRSESLSIIIPTHNRPEFIRRTLFYYHSAKCNFRLVISDSSDVNKKKENIKIIKAYKKKLFITYFHTEQSFHYKIKEALNRVDSDYVTLCSDKDFIVIKNLVKCVNFLRKNNDYCLAIGKEITFLNIDEYSLLSCSMIFIRINENYDCEFEQASDRLSNYLSNYFPIVYSVIRTKSLINAVNKSINISSSPNRFSELILSTNLIINGKAKLLNLFLIVRQYHSSTGSASKKWHHEIYDQSFKTKYAAFVNVLIKNLCLSEGMKHNKAEGIVQKSLENYFAPIMINAKIKRDVENDQKKSFIIYKILHLEVVLINLANLILFLIRFKISKATVLKLFTNFCETKNKLLITYRLYNESLKIKRIRNDYLTLGDLVKKESKYYQDILQIYHLIKKYPNGFTIDLK